MNKQYYAIKTDGSQIGPYPESTLRILWQSGYLRADNPVWTEGCAPRPLQDVLKNAAGEAPDCTTQQNFRSVPTPIAEWNPINAFMTVVFKRYSDFSGRASRSEFWFFFLAQVLVNLLATVALIILATPIAAVGGENAASVVLLLGYIGLNLALLVPSIALIVRRLHDCGQSGWMALMGLLPYVGGICILIFALRPSTPANQWGVAPNPPLK